MTSCSLTPIAATLIVFSFALLAMTVSFAYVGLANLIEHRRLIRERGQD